jgi:hypothetical protein
VSLLNSKQDTFLDHLDKCKQCEQHPFALCKIGDALMREDAIDPVFEQRTNARKVPGVGGFR